MNTKTSYIDLKKLNAPHILIVDDDQMIREMLKKILNKAGYNVKTLESSGQALEELIDFKYHLILLDGNMPGISGFELLKYCRKHHPLMEVIMISGNQDMNSAVSTIKDGAFDYIPKPFTIPQITEVVEKAIAKRKYTINQSVTGTQTLELEKDSIVPGYKNIRSLGAGTMGIVELVENKNVKYDYKALKILKQEETENISQVSKIKRFLREAEIMQGIDHNNIVKIFDSGMHKGKTPYILMEYVSGTPLTNYIKKNELTLEEKFLIIAQLASALHEVHQKGVLHRDLKPGNIIINQDKEPKLLDFGIARIEDSSLTMEYEVLGSPAYMSPESFDVKSDQLTAASDIFSFGILSYELITGEKPFMGETVNEMVNAIQTENPIPPSMFEPTLSEEAENILAKMLCKNIKGRYKSTKTIFEDINNLGKKKTGLIKKIFSQVGKERVWS